MNKTLNLAAAAMLATFAVTSLVPTASATCEVNLGTCTDGGDCTVNTGLCTDDGRCAVNGGWCADGGNCPVNAPNGAWCFGGTCTVNMWDCWYSSCDANLVTGSCVEGSSCDVNTGRCAGGSSCDVNTGDCDNGGSCLVNLGTCNGGSCYVNLESGDCREDCWVNGGLCDPTIRIIIAR